MSERAGKGQEKEEVQAPAWVIEMKGDRAGRGSDREETKGGEAQGAGWCWAPVWWEGTGIFPSSFLPLGTQPAATWHLQGPVTHGMEFS